MIWLFLYVLHYFYSTVCLSSFDIEDDRAMLDWYPFVEQERQGMCITVFKIFKGKTFQQFVYVYIRINILLLVPVVAFMIFDDPHDCFMCIGKDPDRPYSKF